MSREQLMQEIRAARATLERLERRLEGDELGEGIVGIRIRRIRGFSGLGTSACLLPVWVRLSTVSTISGIGGGRLAHGL